MRNACIEDGPVDLAVAPAQIMSTHTVRNRARCPRSLSERGYQRRARSQNGSLNLFFDLFWAGINYHFLAVMGSRSPTLSELPPTRLTRA